MCEKDGEIIFKDGGLKLNSEKDVEEIVNKIEKCENLHTLTLTGSTLGVEAAKSIGHALKSKKTLKNIYMSDIFTGRNKNEIPAALEFIFDGVIESKAQIETLDLSDNAFGPHGMKAMQKFFSTASDLKVLILNNNGLGSIGSGILSEAILRNEKSLNLIELHCGRNRLEDAGVKNICTILSSITSLKVLRIPQNGIKHKGVTVLCESLIKNNLLTCIDLNDNILTEIGSLSLASVVEKLEFLEELDLGDCLLRNKGGVHLSRALKLTKSPLNILNIGYNELKANVGQLIIETVIEKNIPVSLLIDGNMFGKTSRGELSKLLEKCDFVNYDCFDNDESTDDSDEEQTDEDPLEAEFRKMELR